MNSSHETLRLRWFGGFTGAKAFGTVFTLTLASIAYLFGATFHAILFLLMLSTGYFDGWTEVDLERAQVRRVV